MKVAVVILNWNGRNFLEKFLPNVVKYSESAHISIADNASTDDSIAFLKNHYPQIKIIQNTKNEGFCRGYNLALNEIEADYYVLLNSDVEVTQNWLFPAINYLENNQNIAALQPKIKSYYQKEQFEYAGAAGGFLDRDGYPFCRGRLFDTLENDHNQFDEIAEIGWASGACFFVRASVFNQLGGLDEDFFAHMEEIDLCWRIWNAGYRIVYYPHCEIFHIGGGTLPKKNSHKTFLNFRNSLYLFHKNYPGKDLPIKFLKRLLMDGLAGVKFLLQGYPLDTLAIVKAHFAYYIAIPLLHKKRSASNHNSHKMLKKYSIVWGYFVLRKKIFADYK
ncbi:MAG: glycosyltransferase family 2 protein [Cytophagales bacterium]